MHNFICFKTAPFKYLYCISSHYFLRHQQQIKRLSRSRLQRGSQIHLLTIEQFRFSSILFCLTGNHESFFQFLSLNFQSLKFIFLAPFLSNKCRATKNHISGKIRIRISNSQTQSPTTMLRYVSQNQLSGGKPLGQQALSTATCVQGRRELVGNDAAFTEPSSFTKKARNELVGPDTDHLKLYKRNSSKRFPYTEGAYVPCLPPGKHSTLVNDCKLFELQTLNASLLLGEISNSQILLPAISTFVITASFNELGNFEFTSSLPQGLATLQGAVCPPPQGKPDQALLGTPYSHVES